MYFKRTISEDLLAWSKSPVRKPLVLMGARQTGKTSLLKELGKVGFKQLAYFNFEEQPDLKQFFETTKDVNRIIQNLSIVHGGAINPDDTLIVFDEIQECRPALNTLKYFYENVPQYAVASAGSLLGIALGRGASFPVGMVEFFELQPLTFSEFLEQAEPGLATYVKSLDLSEPVLDLFFHHLVEKFKMYFLCGGMPEAAKNLVADNDTDRMQKSLNDVLLAYRLDFAKHANPKDIAKIGYVWDSIPSQLARDNKKFLYQAVKTGARAREYEDSLLWLIQAGLVHKVNRISRPGIPLSSYDDLSAFKLFLLDVGLLRTMAHLDQMAFSEHTRLFTEFKGALTENYILQSLISQFKPTPRYWVSEGKAEVDFLIQYKNEVIPVEVKSEENVRSKSLTMYYQKYSPPVRIRYSLKNLQWSDGLLNIPLFLADYTRKFVDQVI
ncbi:MAG: ATP-binding protein [Bacteroidales bacterium]|nr:ATP-binding protein [Bacteroidales bacterium]